MFLLNQTLPLVTQEGRIMKVYHKPFSENRQTILDPCCWIFVDMQTEGKNAFNDSGQRIQKYLNSTHNLIKHLREIVRDNIKSKLIAVGGREGESLL